MGHKSNEIPETPEEKELAKIATERWADYKQRFIPVENQAIEQVNQMGQSELYPNTANLDTQASYSRGQGQLTGGMTARGQGPGSPGFGLNLASYNIDRAASSGLGQANAYGLRKTQYINNLQNLVAMGQGQAGSALSGLSDAAGAAQRQSIIDAQASIAARGAIGQGVGTAVGMSYGNYQNNKPNPFGDG